MTRTLPDIVKDTQLNIAIHPGYTSIVHQDEQVNATTRPRRIEERWKRSRRAGKGGFGTVWVYRCVAGVKQGQTRAVKELERGEGDLSSKLVRELEAIARFSQIRYRYCFVQSFGWYESGKKLYITMEYLEKGDLSKYLSQPIPEKEAAVITSQIVEALGYIHNNGFIHRDLKPQNILVRSTGPEWWIKISDFGIAKKVLESSGLTTAIGSESYMAPELRGLFPKGNKTGGPASAMDMWAVGVLAWRMATNTLPISANDLPSHVHLEKDLSLESEAASEACRDFVQKLLTWSAGDRLTCHEAHEHPWLQQHQDPTPDPAPALQLDEEDSESVISTGTEDSDLQFTSWTTKNDSTLLVNPNLQPREAASPNEEALKVPSSGTKQQDHTEHPVTRNSTATARGYGPQAGVGLKMPPQRDVERTMERDSGSRAHLGHDDKVQHHRQHDEYVDQGGEAIHDGDQSGDRTFRRNGAAHDARVQEMMSSYPTFREAHEAHRAVMEAQQALKRHREVQEQREKDKERERRKARKAQEAEEAYRMEKLERERRREDRRAKEQQKSRDMKRQMEDKRRDTRDSDVYVETFEETRADQKKSRDIKRQMEDERRDAYDSDAYVETFEETRAEKKKSSGSRKHQGSRRREREPSSYHDEPQPRYYTEEPLPIPNRMDSARAFIHRSRSDVADRGPSSYRSMLAIPTPPPVQASAFARPEEDDVRRSSARPRHHSPAEPPNSSRERHYRTSRERLDDDDDEVSPPRLPRLHTMAPERLSARSPVIHRSQTFNDVDSS